MTVRTLRPRLVDALQDEELLSRIWLDVDDQADVPPDTTLRSSLVSGSITTLRETLEAVAARRIDAAPRGMTLQQWSRRMRFPRDDARGGLIGDNNIILAAVITFRITIHILHSRLGLVTLRIPETAGLAEPTGELWLANLDDYHYMSAPAACTDAPRDEQGAVADTEPDIDTEGDAHHTCGDTDDAPLQKAIAESLKDWALQTEAGSPRHSPGGHRTSSHAIDGDSDDSEDGDPAPPSRKHRIITSPPTASRTRRPRRREPGDEKSSGSDADTEAEPQPATAPEAEPDPFGWADLAGNALTETTRDHSEKAQCTLATARNLLRLDDTFRVSDLADYCCDSQPGDITTPPWAELLQTRGAVRPGEVAFPFEANLIDSAEELSLVRLAACVYQHRNVGHVIALLRIDADHFRVYDNERRQAGGVPILYTTGELLGWLRAAAGTPVLHAVVEANAPLVQTLKQKRIERNAANQQQPIDLLPSPLPPASPSAEVEVTPTRTSVAEEPATAATPIHAMEYDDGDDEQTPVPDSPDSYIESESEGDDQPAAPDGLEDWDTTETADTDSHDEGDGGGAQPPDASPATAPADAAEETAKTFLTAVSSVNLDGVPMEMSILALQNDEESAKLGDRSKGTVQKRKGSRGQTLFYKLSHDYLIGDGRDGRTVLSAKQLRLAALITRENSVVLGQEVHLTQEHGKALLNLLKDNFPIDGEYKAGVPGKGAKRPRKETAGVLTLWHREMWQRALGDDRPVVAAAPWGRILTVHLESLVDASELYVTNGYAPQGGRTQSEMDEFGQSMLAVARQHAHTAPHVIGMDANGGIPGHEAHTGNDRWLAELMRLEGAAYTRAGLNRSTHYSIRGYTGDGAAGWRAAVYHAAIQANKRPTVTRRGAEDAWVLVPRHLWSDDAATSISTAATTTTATTEPGDTTTNPAATAANPAAAAPSAAAAAEVSTIDTGGADSAPRDGGATRVDHATHDGTATSDRDTDGASMDVDAGSGPEGGSAQTNQSLHEAAGSTSSAATGSHNEPIRETTQGPADDGTTTDATTLIAITAPHDLKADSWVSIRATIDGTVTQIRVRVLTDRRKDERFVMRLLTSDLKAARARVILQQQQLARLQRDRIRRESVDALSWRDFVLARVTHQVSPDSSHPRATDEDGPAFSVLIEPATVPRAAPFKRELTLTAGELMRGAAEWRASDWSQLSTERRWMYTPPQAPALLFSTWRPGAHMQAPVHDEEDDDDEWMALRKDDPQAVQAEVERLAAEAQAVANAGRAAAAPAARGGPPALEQPLEPPPPPPDPKLLAEADDHAKAEAELPLEGTIIDHILLNPMARAKLRRATLGARFSGTVNYHLTVVAVFALRHAPITRLSTGRSRDYRRIQPAVVSGADGKEREIPGFAFVTEGIARELEELQNEVAHLPPYERAGRLAERAQKLADDCMPRGAAPTQAATIRPRKSKLQALREVVDKWNAAALEARDRLTYYKRLEMRATLAAKRTHQHATDRFGADPPDELRASSYQGSKYLRTMPTVYERLFRGKRLESQTAEVRVLWDTSSDIYKDVYANDNPIQRAARELAACRRQLALHELALNREAASLSSFTRGMELQVALRTASNFAAAMWASYGRTRRGDAATRGADAPLTGLRSLDPPHDIIQGPGPTYDKEMVRQVNSKWSIKHVSAAAVEYVCNLVGYGNRALPTMSDESAWIDLLYTMTNLKRSLRKIRPNLAQGQNGPHLYPFAQAAGNAALAYFLGCMKEAAHREHRHSSFDQWRLIFILKKGRDRYDLKGGCRPIVALSHLLANDERMLQPLVEMLLNAVRTDTNVGYKKGTTLTQAIWYHRAVHEQASHFCAPCLSYFGDMVSFFDEISHALLDLLTPKLNIPRTLMGRLKANSDNAVFHTATPHGVVVGGTPEKGVGQGRALSCLLSMLPLELIVEFIAWVVPGELFRGRDGNRTATSLVKACDDASSTRTGAHARHLSELLATAAVIVGPIVTGLANGYAMGKTSTHASRPAASGKLEPATDADGMRVSIPSLDAEGQQTLEHTGDEQTLLGHELAPVIDHGLTDDKRAKSQNGLQQVALNTGGTTKGQAVSGAAVVAVGCPGFYNRATIPQPETAGKLFKQLRAGFTSRAYAHESCNDAQLALPPDCGPCLKLPLDTAIARAALFDDFLRCLGAPSCSPQSKSTQALITQYAFMRGFEPTAKCRSALEYVPATLDPALARRYLVEAIWQIAADAHVTLHRSHTDSEGALGHDCVGFATPARRRSRFLRDCPPVAPTPRQTAAGINKLLDLFDGCDVRGRPKLLTAERAFLIYGSAGIEPLRGLDPSSSRDRAEMKVLLDSVRLSSDARQGLEHLAARRSKPCLEIRQALEYNRPRQEATFTLRAWRQLQPPLLPIYHVVTRRDEWCSPEGTWLTQLQLERRLLHLAALAHRHGAPDSADDAAFCRRQYDELPARLKAVMWHARRLIPKTARLPPATPTPVVGATASPSHADTTPPVSPMALSPQPPPPTSPTTGGSQLPPPASAATATSPASPAELMPSMAAPTLPPVAVAEPAHTAPSTPQPSQLPSLPSSPMDLSQTTDPPPPSTTPPPPPHNHPEPPPDLPPQPLPETEPDTLDPRDGASVQLPRDFYTEIIDESTGAPGAQVWRDACALDGTTASDAARATTTRWCVDVWAPAMAYPFAPSDRYLNRTVNFQRAVEHSWAKLNETHDYPGGTGADGKQRMGASPPTSDLELGRRDPGIIPPELATALHVQRRREQTGQTPHPLTATGTAHLFNVPNPTHPTPYVSDLQTLSDPLRRPFVQSSALEDPKGGGVCVYGLHGEMVWATMESKEYEDLSEENTRTAYTVVEAIAANLPGGVHVLRIGDGAHKPSPRDPAVGLATAWAVYRGPHNYARAPSRRAGRRSVHRDTDAWRHESAVAYGGNLGPGSGINSGEVAAMIACLREAIALRRSSRWCDEPYFNVLYGTDSKSCAHEVASNWEQGDLSLVQRSKIAPLIETWLHLRNELHQLGGFFATFKLPGHGGVYPMAGADACAKACLDMPAREVQLSVRSTLAILRAIPRNPATLQSGADATTWRRWEGAPTAHAVSTRYMAFIAARLAEAEAARLLHRYVARSQSGGVRFCVDRVQAGIDPPPDATPHRWTRMLHHFGSGVRTFGSEDGSPNESTVALAVGSGGCLVHGAHVCTCGAQLSPDAYHWIVGCPHGPSRQARDEASKHLLAAAELLAAADSTPQTFFTAVDDAVRVLCQPSPAAPLDADGEQCAESECIAAPRSAAHVPPGYRVAPPPTAAQLDKGNPASDALIGRKVLVRWTALGWCCGTIDHRGPCGELDDGAAPETAAVVPDAAPKSQVPRLVTRPKTLTITLKRDSPSERLGFGVVPGTVTVDMITEGGLAGRNGLSIGDALLEINGKTPAPDALPTHARASSTRGVVGNGTDTIQRLLADRAAAREVTLRIRRNVIVDLDAAELAARERRAARREAINFTVKYDDGGSLAEHSLTLASYGVTGPAGMWATLEAVPGADPATTGAAADPARRGSTGGPDEATRAAATNTATTTGTAPPAQLRTRVTNAEWIEAVLVACGGMPHPGSDAIRQASARLDDGDTTYDGTTTATPTAERKKESAESRLRRAVDKHLQRFWMALLPSFAQYTEGLRTVCARSEQGYHARHGCHPRRRTACDA